MHQSTQEDPATLAPVYRIGAVAKLTGIPVSTLRIWEVRHHAFSPSKTAGKHRLYSPADVQKAGLLKQLSKEGHAISTIAALQAPALQQLQADVPPTGAPAAQPGAAGTPSLALVGPGLAGRVGSRKFSHGFLDRPVRVSDAFATLAQASSAGLRETPDILLVKVNTLHDSVRQEIETLARRHGVAQSVVVYGFGQEPTVETMRASGMLVRREPVSDQELSDLIGSVLLVDTARAPGRPQPEVLIPPRKYSDETLARVAGIASDVLCECPRHVAELITQLASFEQYSQECLNKNDEDAHLHAHLHAIAGSARALFERALEKVAEHENIALQVIGAPPA